MEDLTGNTSNMEANPFSALFPSVDDAVNYSLQENISSLEDEIDSEDNLEEMVDKLCNENDVIERIFLITVDNEQVTQSRFSTVPPYCILMEEFSSSTYFIKVEEIESLLMERLLLTDPHSNIVLRHGRGNNSPSDEVSEHHPLSYLVACHSRAQNEDSTLPMELLPTLHKCRQQIVQKIKTCLLSSDVFNEVIKSKEQPDILNIHDQLYHLLQQTDPQFHTCLKEVAYSLYEDSPSDLQIAFTPILSKITNTIVSKNTPLLIIDPDLQSVLDVILSLSCDENLGNIVLHLQPNSNVRDISTIFVHIFSKSTLLTNPSAPENPFFGSDASLQRGSDEDYRTQICIERFHSKLHKIFKNLLKHPKSKESLLSWVGGTLDRFSEFTKMWIHRQAKVTEAMYPSDALFLNLTAVLVRLAQPFCVSNKKDSATNQRFLKIDPSYCLASGEKDSLLHQIHSKNLHKDTCILAMTDDDKAKIEIADSYNFVTECFFMAHRAMQIGMHGLFLKFEQLNQELGPLSDAYQEVMGGVGGIHVPAEIADPVKTQFKKAMGVFLSTKATLCEPKLTESLAKFHVTTACFLNQIAFTDDRTKLCEIKLPFVNEPSEALHIIPEFVVSNLVDFFTFLKRYYPDALESLGTSLNHMLLFISLYMGNNKRMNRHLRSSFSDVLESILPLENKMSTSVTCLLNREENFHVFEYVGELTISVLQLFVDIEQEYNDFHAITERWKSKRPLYAILEFLWKDSRGKISIKKCAVQSVKEIESSTPPVLLSFINLFLNDSISLLDDAIQYLGKTKEHENEKERGLWDELTREQRQEKEKELKQFIGYSGFCNNMANESIKCLCYLSVEEELKHLLCHSVMVVRLAEMLNYFLLALVGPKRGKLRVRDFSHCQFKPDFLVFSLCTIYINLSSSREFCEAVSKDGRSYNSDLFPRTLRVLRTIGHNEICDDILSIAEKIKSCGDANTEEEGLLENAPDDFFDPIMGSLMKDPVVLPSNVVMDRSTIARHLLSDPTDPYTREPLSLDQVTEDKDLKEKINQWFESKKKKTKKSVGQQF